MRRTPFERLIMITNVLAEAGERGRPALVLAQDLGYAGTSDSKRDQLSRDIRSLRRAGLEITNISELGDESQWVLRPRDSRVMLAFSDDQRAELARAALLAGDEQRERLLGQVGDPGSPDVTTAVAVQGERVTAALEQLLHAVASRCRITFEYSGKRRTVDPHEVEHGASGWWVRGLESESERIKTYTVSRMSEVGVDLPGTSQRPTSAEHPSPDPLTWPVDDPIVAVVSCESEFERDVRSLLGIADAGLGTGTGAVAQEPATGRVRLETRVTNRRLFLARIMELGERVRLESPDVLRAALRDRLLAVIG